MKTRGPFFEDPEKSSHTENRRKISNLMITELFYPYIVDMKKSSLYKVKKVPTYIALCFKIQVN